MHRHALSLLVLWMRPNFDLDTLACELLPQYRALDGEDVPHETKSDRMVLRKGGTPFPYAVPATWAPYAYNTEEMG